MNGENINIPPKPLRVLISPLHWGLGHATRIIPVIKTLQEQGVEVLMGATGGPAVLLQKEFPHIRIIPAPGLTISYPTQSKWFFFKMLLQTPEILTAVKKENTWVKKVVAENRIDAIISDNRFGLVVRGLPCVFISHQLYINAPNAVLRWISQKINYFYIQQFRECWVPDIEKGLSLAGKLSHPKTMPAVPVHYMGPLSRLIKKEAVEEKHVLVLLSGPEPQRSMWEDELMKQLNGLADEVVLIRGLPNETRYLERR